MSFPTVSIGGVDRPYLVPQSISISWPKRGRRTAQFALFDDSQLYRPVVGSPVILTDGGTRFVGLISKIRESREGDGLLDLVRFHCDCSDYAAIFDRRFVSRRYPAGSIATNIIVDICQNFLLSDGFTTSGVDGFTTLVDELVFDYRSVTECFNQISELTGEDWWVTGAAGKDIYFKSLANAPVAPFSITDTSANWRGLEVNYDSSQYRNRQYLRAGATLQTGTMAETFTGDGVRWFFPTQFVLTDAPTVTVGGAAQTVYEMNVDAYPAAGWFWMRGGGGVQQGTQTPVGVGVAVVVSYGSYDSSVVMAEDSTEQAARAAIEGGSGIWESVDEVREVDNITTAQALTAGLLARHKAMPATIEYETDEIGLEPGQVQRVQLTANGIEGVGVESLGPELVINGAFDSSDEWTFLSGWTFTGGEAHIVASSYTLSQGIGIVAGNTYRITWDMVRTSGGILVSLGGIAATQLVTASGSNSIDLAVPVANDAMLYIVPLIYTGSIDNVSVKLLDDGNTAPFYVTQVNSRDSAGAALDSGYYFRHRVTLSSVRDQGDWLAWWLNFYRQSKPSTGSDSAAAAVDVPDVTNVDCGTPIVIAGPSISIPTTFKAPSPLGIFSAYEPFYRIGTGEAVSLGVFPFSGSAGATVSFDAVVPYQYADVDISIYVVSRSADAADVLSL